MLENYKKWVTSFMESWKNIEGIKTTDLLSKEVEYYENPIDGPCESFENIIKLWEVVPDNQKDITYTFEILAYNEKTCIINWQMERMLIPTNEKQQIDGLFQISLDDNGLCIYFKQWRFTKSIK